MTFSSSSVLIYDNTSNTVVSFETNQSTPYSVTVGAAYEGVTLDYVVSRAGYTKSLGQFVGGGAISLSTTPTQRTDPDGTPAYTGTTSANITVSFTFSPSLRCFIDIGDASVSSQTIVDEIEDALETENGCRFLAETGGATCLQAVLAGQTYLLLGANYRLRRTSAGDVNAAVDAYVISADGIPLDGTNGGVQFLTAQDVASEIWGALTSDHAVSGSFGQLIKDYLNASIADILTDTGTTIPAQIAALNDFNPATDTVTVGVINNNVITSSTIAVNALNDSAFTTGYFNAINSEVDTALADYDAPTKAELDTAQASIQGDIAALNDISTADIRTELSTELGRIDTAISTRLATSGYTTPPTTAEIEAALLNEGDGQQLIDAIVTAIGNSNVDEVALVAAIRADLERVGGMLDNVPTLSEIEASTVLAKTADIAGLNDITAADVWANATRTVTGGTIDTNLDMRGTDNALLASSYTAPDNASITAILADTNELQTNQGNWITATGFATPTNVTDARDVVQADIAALNDLSSADITAAVPTAAQIATQVETQILDESDGRTILNAIVGAIGNENVDEIALVASIRSDLERTGGILDNILTDTGTTIPTQIAALNDFDPTSDTVTVGAINNNVITSSTIATNALNDSAFTTGYFNAINSEVDTALTDYDAPTKAELDTAQAAIQSDITALNDIAASDVVTAMQAVANDFKADVSNLATSAELTTVNEGVKKASLFIPHTDDL